MQPKLLIVDSDATSRKILHSYFYKDQLKLSVAPNGYDALRHLINEGIPDLILIDLDMPKFDGYGLLRILRSQGITADFLGSLDSAVVHPKLKQGVKGIIEFNRGLRRVPVIVMSSEDSRDRILKTQRMGIQGYVRKPFEETTLRNRVGAVLPLENGPWVDIDNFLFTQKA